ncbi:MAG: TolC family protein [Candidatus Omnitrophica bacterium]|nr:TolC family protein [Candidatus Omnitrophota bacterium]
MDINFRVEIKNFILRSVFLIFVYFCMTVGPVFAQIDMSSKLESLIEEALANNPGIKAAEAEWQAVKMKIPQSSSLPDPTVGYTVMGPMLETSLGPQEDAYEFEQMIPFPGKLTEKRKMAKAEAEAARARLSKAQKDITLKVSEAYYDLYSVQESLQTTQEVHTLLGNFQKTLQSLYASLKVTQKEINLAQIEVAEVLRKMYFLRQQKQSLLGMLSSLINRNVTEEEFIPFPVLKIQNEVFDVDQLLALADQNQPEIKEAVSLVNRDRHASRLSKYGYAPDISIGFQYYGIGDGETSDPDDGRDAWMIPIKVTIPLWQNRILPTVKEAIENLKVSEARLKDTQNLSAYEIKNAFYKLSMSKEAVDLYEKVLIPQAKLVFNSDMTSYENGKGELLSLIDSERSYLNSKIAYYEALAEGLKNFAALERMVGVDLMTPGGLK